jgi:hypothetical protein
MTICPISITIAIITALTTDGVKPVIETKRIRINMIIIFEVFCLRRSFLNKNNNGAIIKATFIPETAVK